MAKLFGKLTTTETPALEPVQEQRNTEKGFLTYFAQDKFLASFFAFGEEAPKDKGKRLAASMVSRNAKFATMPNADEILRVLLPSGFVEEAKQNGWTLVEAVNHATSIIETKKTAKAESKPKPADEDLKLLCSLLVNVRPETAPADLLKELKEIIEAKGQEAVNRLEEMLKSENPRDKNGYIFLRKVKAKAEATK